MSKIATYGSFEIDVELIAGESREKVALSHSCASDKDDFEEEIVAVVRGGRRFDGMDRERM